MHEPLEREYLKFSDDWFIDRYFRAGSVEAALMAEELPISVASYHRLIQRMGIVPSAGRHTSLPEVLHFFKVKALRPGTPLEEVYRSMPPSFQTSLMTLHRIYHHIERNLVRRNGVALIIKNDEDSILVATERTENNRYKLNGEITVPMGFSKDTDSAATAIFRILQQEVSTELASTIFATNGKMYTNLEDSPQKPILKLRILDVDVNVYEVTLAPSLYNSFTSYKLVNHQFVEPLSLLNVDTLRIGMHEIVCAHVYGAQSVVQLSHLNQDLLAFS